MRKPADDRVIERNAAIQLCYVEVDEPDMHKPLGDLDRLKARAGEGLGLEGPADRASPASAGRRRSCARANWEVTAAIHRDMDSRGPS